MGLGAAMMFPATLSLLTNVFTARRERAAAIGLWGATTGVGIATGPIIGGWLLEHYWWGSVFLFMVPVAAGSPPWPAGRSHLRDPHTPKTDWRGLILSAAGMGVLVLGIIQAPGWGWSSPRAIGTLATGAALLAAFAAASTGWHKSRRMRWVASRSPRRLPRRPASTARGRLVDHQRRQPAGHLWPGS